MLKKCGNIKKEPDILANKGVAPDSFDVIYYIPQAKNAVDFKRIWDVGVEFAAWILKKHGWGVDKMLSHDDCRKKWGGTDHTDPIGYFKKYGKSWAEFIADVDKTLNAPLAPPETSEPVKGNQSTAEKTLYRVQVGAYKLKTNASKMENKLKAAGYDTFVIKVDNLYKVQVGAFAKKQNAESLKMRLQAAGYDTLITTISSRSVTTENKIADLEKTIWDYLLGKGLNAYAVAGIMGNLYAESGLNPKNLQNSYEKALAMTDDSYTAAVDNGSYKNFVQDKAGYGLAQWTFWTRKQALQEFAKNVGKSIGDLSMQLDFMWNELQGYTEVIKALKTASTIRQASDAVLKGYERPADMSDSVQRTRAGYGEAYYKKFA